MIRRPSALLAWRGLRRRPLRALLTTTGIILGVGMIVGVLSLSATLLKGFEELFDVAYGKTDLVVSRESFGPPAPFSRSVLERARETPGVDPAGTTGQVFGTAYLVGADGRAGTAASDQLNLSGVEPGTADLVSTFEVVAGRRIERAGDLALEEGWAREKGLGLGDPITLAVPAGRRTYRVTGVFRFAQDVSFGGTGFGALDLATAQRDLDLPGQLNQVFVQTLDRSRVPEVQALLQAELGDAYAVRTPSGEVDELARQLEGLNTFLLFFAAVALFVGAFLIFNAFTVSVLQRTREIGMLRTLGATRAATVRLVLAEAVALGLAGSLLGLAAGVGLAVGLIALAGAVFVGIPFGGLTIPASALVTGLVVGLAVTLLAALLPALRASRTSPLQAMRRRAEVVGRPAWRSAVAGLVVIAASVPGVWLLSRDDLSAAAEAYGTVAIIGIFLGVALATPLVVRPLVRALAVPLRLAGRTEGRLAADNAARAPGRTALTASAVMIGLALVITFSAFSASAVSAVRDSIDRSLASDFIVVPQNLFSTQGFSPALAREVAALPGARAVSSSRVGAASVDGRVTEVIAVDPETYGEVATTTLVDGGRPDWAALGGPAVLVTQGLADERGLGVGSTITLGGAGTGPEDLRVAGVLDDRLESQSGRAVFVSQRRGVGLGLTQDLRVYAQAGDSPEARAALRQELERAVGAYPAAELLSNEELKNEIESSLNQVFGLLYALLGVAIVAAAVGIANTLAMSVIERTREIGMIRAVGGTRSQLRRMIRRESVLVTMVGVVLGLGVGLLLGYAFVRASAAQFPGLVFRVPWTAVIAVLVGAVVVAVLAAALPARRAARLSVIEAVSYE